MFLRLTYVIIYGTGESKIKTFLFLYINKIRLLYPLGCHGLKKRGYMKNSNQIIIFRFNLEYSLQKLTPWEMFSKNSTKEGEVLENIFYLCL